MMNNPLTPLDVLGHVRTVEFDHTTIHIRNVHELKNAVKDDDEPQFLASLSAHKDFTVIVPDNTDDAILETIAKMRRDNPIEYAVNVVGPALISNEYGGWSIMPASVARYTIVSPVNITDKFVDMIQPVLETGVAVTIMTTGGDLTPVLMKIAREPVISYADGTLILQYPAAG